MEYKPSKNRSIRVFISSTFRDMSEERNALMTHTWPELRRFCRERQVELIEVDLRWGIAEEQSTRNETLSLCMNEIRACRPFFIGILGERYGWVPDGDAITSDLREELPWLTEFHGKSVTELEIMHGVLNNPSMAGRAFFFSRDPDYAQERGTDFLPENKDAFAKQTILKSHIRSVCTENGIPFKENYSDPGELANLVLEQLKGAIEAHFPLKDIPGPLAKSAGDHESFAEIRRRTYIGRPEYFNALDLHISGEGPPLAILGPSGSGKSSLIANWIALHRKTHSRDYIFQYYIGGTPDSTVHWNLMTRLITEIKSWTGDPNDLPGSNDELLQAFPLWLSKARIYAQSEGIRFIIVLDSLNQLQDIEYGRLLAWLPAHHFYGALRLIVSTLPGASMKVVQERLWPTLHIQALDTIERKKMITEYLQRFGKKLDDHRLFRIANSEASSNPLYLKILIDELRVTGTHEMLDERLENYLTAKDISSLLGIILARYQKDYDLDRKDLVRESLCFILAARRGLTEVELLHLLKPAHLPQLPAAIWGPLRAALDESLVDRGGVLNFAHDFLRSAVETAFLPDPDNKNVFRMTLADYFETQAPDERTCDELPWLLWKTESTQRLRKCLLSIDHFIEIQNRDENELLNYWVYLNEQGGMGKPYLDSFKRWYTNEGASKEEISSVSYNLGSFLQNAALYEEAEFLYLLSLEVDDQIHENDNHGTLQCLTHLAGLLLTTNRLDESETMMRRVVSFAEKNLSGNDPILIKNLSNLGWLLFKSNRFNDSEVIMRRVLSISKHTYRENHPEIALYLNNLGQLLQATLRMDEAESSMREMIEIIAFNYGENYPWIGTGLDNLAILLKDTGRNDEAELMGRRALKINEDTYGNMHPEVAICLNNLAQLLADTNRMDEAEPMMRRALEIDEACFDQVHPKIAIRLNNLALLLNETNRTDEAETLMRKALEIDEAALGKNHPDLATSLNNLSMLLENTNRRGEAKSMALRSVEILIQNTRSSGYLHPNLRDVINNYIGILVKSGMPIPDILVHIKQVAPEFPLE